MPGHENNITTFKKIEEAVLEFIEETVDKKIKDYPVSLEINGALIDISEIKYFDGEMKVIAVYHDQAGFSLGE